MQTEPTKCTSRVLGWPVIGILSYWFSSALAFTILAVLGLNLAQSLMAAACLFIGTTVLLRWRLVFWISTVGVSAAAGCSLARVLAVDSPARALLLTLAIAVTAVIVHQTPTFLKWFAFSEHRKTRLQFWLLTSIVCIVSEFWLFRLLPKDL